MKGNIKYQSLHFFKNIANLTPFCFWHFQPLKFKIELGKQHIRIQHTQIVLEKLFTNFSPKMPTAFYFHQK